MVTHITCARPSLDRASLKFSTSAEASRESAAEYYHMVALEEASWSVKPIELFIDTNAKGYMESSSENWSLLGRSACLCGPPNDSIFVIVYGFARLAQTNAKHHTDYNCRMCINNYSV